MFPQRILHFSLTANLLLLGTLGYLVLHNNANRQPRAEERVLPLSTPTPTPPPPPPDPPRFQWSQIESPDYLTYIANLRGIDCPEPTIRDIISADVENLFEQKRRELRGRGLSPLDLDRELEALRQQQGDLLVRLLGAQNGLAQAGSSPGANGAPETSATPAHLPTLQKVTPVPIVLLTPDPSLNLTASQKEDWEYLTNEFITAIGGLNQNPNDPEYLSRWKKALLESNERARVFFGDEAYLKFHTWSAQEMAGLDAPAR